jgi:hypothetical protein
MLLVAAAVLAAGIASIIGRDPNIGIRGASADPHAVDPFAAALGADVPSWRDDGDAPSSRLPFVGTPLDARIATGVPARPAPSPESSPDAGIATDPNATMSLAPSLDVDASVEAGESSGAPETSGTDRET